MEDVNGKPIRGIISDVQFSTKDDRATAILDSPDFCQGESGRNEITQGRGIRTSVVQAFDVIEGQLVLVTENSAYIVDGPIGILELTMAARQELWDVAHNDAPALSRSMTGLSS